MSGVVIKICGIRDAEGLTAAANAGATHVGFNFVRTSPRYIKPQKALGVAALAPERLERVALFADALDHEIEDVIKAIRPQWLQLHGRELPDRVRFIRKRFDLPVIRAVAVATAADIGEGIAAYGTVADRLMFDAKPASGAAGGRGTAFDWTLLSGVDVQTPWILAGGLTADNVAEAVRVTGTRGVDVSSGVESAPGVKDPALIKRFVAAARAAFQDRESA